MKKNYNVPATEVIAFVGGAIMQAGSGGGGTDPLNYVDPNNAIPGGEGGNG